MVAIMVTLCCALMVHVRARPVDLGNLVSDAPNRLDVADLFMQRYGVRYTFITELERTTSSENPQLTG